MPEAEQSHDKDEQADCGQEVDSRPAEGLIQGSNQKLKAELMRDIGQLVSVKGMDGIMQYGVMGDHIAAQLNMPERIRVIVRRLGQQQKNDGSNKHPIAYL
ncbi:hypothetical protein D3C75_1066790 [compost metagenome]